jgi:hypothetical protein
MSTCVLPLQPFDGSSTRVSIAQISNSVDIELLDAFIGLIATDKASA